MAFLVLGDDITNAHHVSDDELSRLVNDCLVTRERGHEVQTIWRCERCNGSEPSHIFHIVTAIPSEGHDAMHRARKRSSGEKYAAKGASR
jgi:hypothetical protein